MNILNDVITYVRRLIKSPSDATITDNLIIDYINRFWIMDVDARIQLFDLKTTYKFQTSPGVDQYNMPLYDIQTQPGSQDISFYPVYQGFLSTARVNGITVPFYTQRSAFINDWSSQVQSSIAIGTGDGGSTYTLQLPFSPSSSTSVNQIPSGIVRGHVDISGIIATGQNIDPPLTAAGASTNFQNIPTTSVSSGVYFTSVSATGASVVVADSGQFLTSNVNYGLLMAPGNAPLGDNALTGGYSTTSNTINYNTGVASVTFPAAIPAGQAINAQCQWFNPGRPVAVLFYNNVLTLRSIPDTQYTVELDAYLTPAAFLSLGASLPFAYMAEYIARGAARKILSDTGDSEQFAFYEPLFREQEMLVWKRSQRQFTATRTETIYSRGSQGANRANTGII